MLAHIGRQAKSRQEPPGIFFGEVVEEAFTLVVAITFMQLIL